MLVALPADRHINRLALPTLIQPSTQHHSAQCVLKYGKEKCMLHGTLWFVATSTKARNWTLD